MGRSRVRYAAHTWWHTTTKLLLIVVCVLALDETRLRVLRDLKQTTMYFAS